MSESVVETFSGCGGSSRGWKLAGATVRLAVEWDDNAVATYRLNYPTTPIYHGDIAKLTSAKALELGGLRPGELDVLSGSPPCFPAGTPVETDRGWIPIEEVVGGDMVLTHRGRFRRVERVGSKAWTGELVEVSTKYSAMTVKCTPEHPFLVRRGGATTWIAASELAVSVPLPGNKPGGRRTQADLVLRPRVERIGPTFEPVKIWYSATMMKSRAPRVDLEALAWLLGFWVAEGHLRGHGDGRRGVTHRTVIYSVGAGEAADTARRLVDAGFNPSVSRATRGAAKVSVSDVDLWSVCESFGRGAGNKRIPAWVHGMGRAWIAAFLAGYFAGDGCTRQNARSRGTTTKATTVSEQLAYGVAGLVAEVHGVAASVDMLYAAHQRRIEGRTVNVRDAFSVGYRPTIRDARPGKVDDDGAWVPVRALKRVPFSGRVYNIEVVDDNSYVVRGLAVHNCQGFSTSGKRDMDDNRNQLFKEYARLLRELQPRAFVMENVRGMIIGDMKEIFYEIIAELRGCGYKVKAGLLNAKWYGVPQSRDRVIFVGIREDLGVEPSHPAPTVSRPITVREALAGVDIKWMPPPLTERYRQLWHRLRPGRSIKDDVMRRIGSPSFFSTIKVNPDKPSMTICKTVRRDGFGGICHWEEPRVLAIEEIMRLTSFPDDYQFVGEFEERWARIGNCVPPLLMKAVAEHVLKLLRGAGGEAAAPPLLGVDELEPVGG